MTNVKEKLQQYEDKFFEGVRSDLTFGGIIATFVVFMMVSAYLLVAHKDTFGYTESKPNPHGQTHEERMAWAKSQLENH